jgi:hypothetical protein
MHLRNIEKMILEIEAYILILTTLKILHKKTYIIQARLC